MDLEQIKLTLGILQLDPADRAVIRIADQRDAMQRRAFTIWINERLAESPMHTQNWSDCCSKTFGKLPTIRT
ncbi:hypothetical protein AAHC03_013392 [Spirometra sp. Aus1]